MGLFRVAITKKKPQWRASEILRKKMTRPRVLLSSSLTLSFGSAQMDSTVILSLLNELQKNASAPHIQQEIEHALLALQSGKLATKPDLFSPETQYIWAVIFAALQKNPDLTQQWPQVLQPPAKLKKTKEKVEWLQKSGLWQQFADALRMKKELLQIATNAVDATGDRTVRVKWGPPGSGIHYMPERNLLSVDMQLTLNMGFEHIQGLVLEELARGTLSRQYPQTMRDLSAQISPLRAKQKQRGNKLEDADYKKLRLLSKEWQLHNNFFEAAERTPIRHFVEHNYLLGDQDYSYDLNVGAVIRNFHFGAHKMEDMRNAEPTAPARFANLLRAMDLMWYQNNNLFENSNDEWRHMGVHKDWIRPSRGHAHKIPVGMSGFDYLRQRLVTAAASLQNIIPDESERMMGQQHYQGLIEAANQKRNALIQELWEVFAEDLAKELLIEEDKKIDQEMEDKKNQDPQDSDDSDGDESGDDGDEADADGDASQSSDKKGKKDKNSKNKPEKGDKKDKPEKGDKKDKPEKGDKKEKAEKSEKDNDADSDENSDEKTQSDPDASDEEKARDAQQKQEQDAQNATEKDDKVDVDDVGEMDDVDAGAESPEQRAEQQAGLQDQKQQNGQDADQANQEANQDNSEDANAENSQDSDNDAQQGEESDGQDGDGQDGQTMEELEEDVQEAMDAESQDADGDDSDDADADDADAEAGGDASGAAQKPGGQKGKPSRIRSKQKQQSRAGGSSSGQEWKDKIDGGWDDYRGKIVELSGPIAAVARILEKIRDKQKETKIKQSKQMDVLPGDEAKDRLNMEKHRELRQKQLTGQQIDKRDRERFFIDQRKTIPTTVDFVILIDGSGSMVGSYGGKSSALASALTAALILQEAAGRVGGFNVYVGMWGGSNVQWVSTPEMKESETAANYKRARSGLHTGTDLSPALEQSVELLIKRPVKSGQKLGRTHVVVLSDGDLNSQDVNPTMGRLQKWLECSKETTIDFAIINQGSYTEMDKIAMRLKAPRRTQEIMVARTDKPEDMPVKLIRMLAQKVGVGKSFNAIPAKKKKQGLRRAYEMMKKVARPKNYYAGYYP